MKGLLLFGSDEQKLRYLPQLASGEVIADLDTHDKAVMIAKGGRGAFVVSEDGYYANYSYCPLAQGCYYSINYSAEAIKSCQSKGYKCIVFAKDEEIIVPYEIAE